MLCGHSSGAPGACCAGSACCGSSCQTSHSNGLGQNYYDCGALNQHTANQAIAAAQAFAPTGTVVAAPNCPNCVCNSSGAASAVWCYSGSQSSGLVQLFTGATDFLQTSCPLPGLSSVFPWD
ncbi:MAG TPA: hypothetical protein VFG53_00150 [Anaeromyxobacter sp.]|nr:hypothetical protein [Anaeromyxobacter sp.]